MKYMLICGGCHYKVYTNGDDLTNLTEIPTAGIPKKATGIDKDCLVQKKKLKCPKCGFVFKIVKLEQAKTEDPRDDREEPKELLLEEPKKKSK